MAKVDLKFCDFELRFIIFALKILEFSNLVILCSCQEVPSIFCRVMYYLSFIVKVVDAKFCIKQLRLCNVPMPIHWHLLFLVSFVILQCHAGFRSNSYPNNLSKTTSFLADV